MYDDALQIFNDGATIATSATSARVALPTNSAGIAARIVRVSALNACYCKFGDVTVVATANNILVQPADAALLTVPKGATHIAGIQEAAAGKINIQPIEY